jgi:hypothetical protein
VDQLRSNVSANEMAIVSRRRKVLLAAASVIAASCPMVLHLDVSHTVRPRLAGSFAVAKSGNGGNAGGNGAGNQSGGRGGSDRGSADNHDGASSHGNDGGSNHGGHGPPGRNADNPDKNANPCVGDVSPTRTGFAQRRAADRAQVPHGPAQGQHATSSAKTRDISVKPQRAQHTVVASGLTDADLAKLMARGFGIQARTKGSLSSRTVQLQPPYGLSLDQARRAVRKINPNAVVDFNTYYYTDRETPEGFSTGTPDKWIHTP